MATGILPLVGGITTWGSDQVTPSSMLREQANLCGGRYDGIATAANLEAMQKQIPGALLELFEGGHLFLIQDPRAFDRIVSFLRGELDD